MNRIFSTVAILLHLFMTLESLSKYINSANLYEDNVKEKGFFFYYLSAFGMNRNLIV